MSDQSTTAQASTDAGAGQAATDQAKPTPDAPASAISAAAAADTKADAAAGATDAADKAKPEGEAKPADGAPEKYELKLPEGMQLDDAALAAATPVFKELGLTNEQAQKLSDIYAARMADVAKQQRDAWTAQQEGLVSSMKSDAEFGGDKFAASLGSIAKAIDGVMGKEAAAFKRMLDSTGAGNHPEMARLLYRVGKALGEDGLVRGDASAQQRTPAEILYPKAKE
jgi:hypothetical protein